MLTGHTSIERVRAARDAGVNEFLAKPVSAKAILTRLISVIEHPRPFVRTKVYFGPDRRRHRDGGYHGPERRASEMPDDACRPALPHAGTTEEHTMAKQQPIEIFMPPNVLKAKVGSGTSGSRRGRGEARRSGHCRAEGGIRRAG